MICATKIHHDQVAYMKCLTEEYVHLRATLFPDAPLKPKHHFLLHYPELTLKFGPLIRLWTLRFESKHTYFKQCARKLRNFKNLGSTLAERHQLLQAYLSAGSIFPPNVQVGEADEFRSHLYNTHIQEAVRMQGIHDSTFITLTATYKGTKYQTSMVVVVDQTDDVYTFGKIEMILIHFSKLFFVVEKCKSVPVVDLGLHFLQQESSPHYLCVNAENLADYYPLPIYKRFDANFVALHHSVCLR